MGCRCRDIESCRHDREVMGRALVKARWIEPDAACLHGKLQRLAEGEPEAYTAETAGETCGAILKLDKDVEPAAEGLAAGIAAKREELEALKRRLEREDHRHHEAERLAAQQQGA